MAMQVTPADAEQIDLELAEQEHAGRVELGKRQKSLTIGAVCKALALQTAPIVSDFWRLPSSAASTGSWASSSSSSSCAATGGTPPLGVAWAAISARGR